MYILFIIPTGAGCPSAGLKDNGREWKIIQGGCTILTAVTMLNVGLWTEEIANWVREMLYIWPWKKNTVRAILAVFSCALLFQLCSSPNFPTNQIQCIRPHNQVLQNQKHVRSTAVFTCMAWANSSRWRCKGKFEDLRVQTDWARTFYTCQMKIQTGTIVVFVMTIISTIILAFFLILLLVTLIICCYDDILQFHTIVKNCYSWLLPLLLLLSLLSLLLLSLLVLLLWLAFAIGILIVIYCYRYCYDCFQYDDYHWTIVITMVPPSPTQAVQQNCFKAQGWSKHCKYQHAGLQPAKTS